MEDDALEKHRKAGKILSKVIAEIKPKVQVGATLLEVAMLAEGAIRREGGEPAFPCNISMDRVAAHYTPGPLETRTFGEEMVKLDIGVHVDGFIADSATTVDLSGHDQLVEASLAALDAAIDLVSAGTNTAEIGKAIEEAISGYGYLPVSNLTGHGLQRYIAHASPTIPNVAIGKGIELKEGDVIAIEPFATNGSGRISEAPYAEIFGLSNHRPVRSTPARQMLQEIQKMYKTLPFARRWLKGSRVDFAISQLLKAGAIHRYPVLWEIEEAFVSQAEHSVIVLEEGCEVFTC